MKKSIYTLLAAVAVLALAAACSKDNGHKSSPKQQVTITASIPEDGLQSKVSLSQDAVKQPIKVEWDDDDVITVNGETFTIDPTTISADGKSAKFTGSNPGAGPYDISYSNVSDFVNQTQSADGNLDHLGFEVSLTGADSYASFSFTETWATAHGATYEGSSVLELKAALPAAIKSSVQKVIFTFPEEITPNNHRIYVTLGNSALDADNQLDVYATLPAGTINLPNILVQFQVSADATDKYSAYREFAANNTIASGSLQYLGIQCANIETFANASNASIGSSSNPYLIGDKHQMVAMHSEAADGATTYFALVDDVDLDNEEWTPLNTGTGYTKAIYFDGRDHTVSHLKSTGSTYPSFAGVLNGTVKDVTFDSATIQSNSKVGGVVAGYLGTNGVVCHCDGVTVSNSTISGTNSCGAFGGIVANASNTFNDCHVSGTTTVTLNYTEKPVGGFAYEDSKGSTYTDCSVHATVSHASGTGTSNNYAGGFIGYLSNGNPVFTRCSVLEGSTVTGNGGVGGFVGYAAKVATFDTCSAAASVTGSADNVGGFVGGAYQAATYTNCSVSGTVSAAGQMVGGFVGRQWNYNAIYTNCSVEDATITATKTDDPRAGGFAGQLGTATVKGCTVGTATKKVTVNTPLPASNKFLNSGGFVGVNYGTITKDDSGNHSIAYVKVTTANTLGQPLHLGGFVGYNSATVTYSDAHVDMSDLKGQHIGGFAGYIVGTSALVDHCSVDGAVKGNNYTGGFVGYVDTNSPTISNCTASGTVEGQSGSGGFVGQSMTGVFTDCSSSATCTFSGTNNGGFVGQIHGGTMTGCSASGNVTAGGGSHGGFAGLIPHSTTLTDCSASGTVTGVGQNNGGFIGLISNSDDDTTLSIIHCHASGAVNNESAYYNGSFIGQINQGKDISIQRCYASGNMTSNASNASAFIGYINRSSGDGVDLNVTIQNCYSTGNVSGSNQMRGGLVAHINDVDGVTISNCYASGASVGSFRIGGLIGNINVASVTVDHCAAWNSEVTASDLATNKWSSGAVVGTAFPTCTLTDNYRRADMPVKSFWGNVTGYTYALAANFSHDNVSSSTPLKDYNGTAMDDTAMASGQTHYPWYPYQGKVEAGKTLSQLASTTLGWDSSIWDFSNDLPTLR